MKDNRDHKASKVLQRTAHREHKEILVRVVQAERKALKERRDSKEIMVVHKDHKVRKELEEHLILFT
jgi:hypothetical protein